MKKRSPSSHQHAVKKFQKKLTSSVLMLIFFVFLFMRIGVPGYVFFFIAIPMTISLIHKYIDVHHSRKREEKSDNFPEDTDWEEEELEEDPLDLEDFEPLRKEWKDSDFV